MAKPVLLGRYLRRNAKPQSHTFLCAGRRVLHFGHFFSCARFVGLLVLALLALFSAARRCRRGASAWDSAHCGWMPANEYEGSPQIGQVLGLGPSTIGVVFFLFMCDACVSDSTAVT
jgi:hypothetical protein